MNPFVVLKEHSTLAMLCFVAYGLCVAVGLVLPMPNLVLGLADIVLGLLMLWTWLGVIDSVRNKELLTKVIVGVLATLLVAPSGILAIYKGITGT